MEEMISENYGLKRSSQHLCDSLDNIKNINAMLELQNRENNKEIERMKKEIQHKENMRHVAVAVERGRECNENTREPMMNNINKYPSNDQSKQRGNHLDSSEFIPKIYTEAFNIEEQNQQHKDKKEQEVRTEKKKRRCRNFDRYGKCDFGNNCWYDHIKTNKPREEKERVCYTYSSGGECRNKSCKYKHIRCKYGKSCRNISRCIYRHADDNIKNNSIQKTEEKNHEQINDGLFFLGTTLLQAMNQLQQPQTKQNNGCSQKTNWYQPNL